MTYPGDDLHNEDPNAESSIIRDTTVEELRTRANSVNRLELFKENDSMEIRQNVEWHGHPPLGHFVLNDYKLLKPK